MTDYYVDGAVGDNGNLGTSEGAGNAWATIDYALGQIIAGDKIWIKASAIYNETATVITAGSFGNEIVLEGYNSTPGDLGQAVIDGQSTRLYGVDCTTGSNPYYLLKNITVQNTINVGYNFGAETGVAFYNCKAVNTGSTGFLTSFSCSWAYCEAIGNVGSGYSCGNTPRLYACIAAGNSSYGIVGTNNMTMYKCLAVNNGISQASFSSHYAVVLNTIDGVDQPAGHMGLNINTGTGLVADNIIVNNETGMGVSSADSVNRLVDYNLFFNNTSNYETTALTLSEVHAKNDVIGDPAFVDAGNYDYTLLDTSAALNVGMRPGALT
jgi:hypothetical protein